MRLQDLSNLDKAWLFSLTLPWGKLYGKVKIDMGTGDIFWSDESAREWFEAERARRDGAERPIPAPPQPSGPELELRRKLAEVEASNILTPAEKAEIRARIIHEYYGGV